MNFLYPVRGILLLLFFTLLIATCSTPVNAQGCLGVGGMGITGGAVSTSAGILCANVDALGGPGTGAELQITAGNVIDGDVVSFTVDWDDGTAPQVVPATKTGPNNWQVVNLKHYFPTTGNDVQCEYIPRVALLVNGVQCTPNFGASPKFTRWNVDDENSGELRLEETTTNVNTYLVCRGTETTVTFTDRSILNCVPPDYTLPNPINQAQRWRRFTYGTVNTVTSATGVEVNGTVQVYPFQGAVVTDNPSIAPLTPTVTLPITIPADAQVGQEFEITMEYWNTCNPFPGTPVTETARIRVVDQPPAPTANNNLVCNGVSPLPDFSITIPGAFPGSVVTWFRDNAGVPGTVIAGYTTASLPASAIGVNNAVAGVYRVWASYYAVNNADGVSCESPRIPVTLTIREDLPIVPIPAGYINQICNDATMTLTLPAAATETIGGATQYVWTVGGGGGVTFTSTATSATFNFSGINFGGAASVTRIIRVNRRYTANPTCTSPNRNLSVQIFAPSVGGTLSTTPDVCETTGVGTINLTGELGTVQRWEVSFNNGPFLPNAALGTGNSITPGIVTAGNYRFRAVVANGVCAEAVSSIETVDVFPNPTAASVGADQSFCQTLLTSTALGGSDPTPGTGAWTVTSRPAGSSASAANFSNATSGNSIFTGDVYGIYTLRWTVTSGSCVSFAELNVEFGTDPGVQNAGTDNAFCGTNGSLNATAPAIGTGRWTQIAGPIAGNTSFDNDEQAATNIALLDTSPAAYGSYTYRWTVVSGNCTPRTDDVIITFNEPGSASVPADFVSCVDQTTLAPITLTGAAVAGGAAQGRWEVVSGSGTFTSNNGNPGAALPAANTDDAYRPSVADFTAGSVQLRFVAIDPDGAGPCGNVNSPTNLTITFDRKPADADAGADFAICEGDVANLNAVAVNNGGIGIWSPATGVADVNDETTTVTGLTTTTTFTWTVYSAMGNLATPPNGSCAATTNDVIVTVNPLPEANDPAPNDLCETIAGTLTTTNVTLSVYDAAIIGAAAPADRTVKWYANAFDQVNDINPITTVDIHDGDKLFVRVIDITTAPLNCHTLQEVNFTVNPKPVVMATSFYYCEEAPAGTGRVDDIDLTLATVGDDITALPAADRTITWYTSQLDAEGAVNLLANPNDIDITANTIYFARVENIHTGCFNVVQVNLIVKPLPADPVITGKGDPCKNGSELYRVGQIAGATYTWTYPPTFQYLGGGGANDFYILLSFPNAVSDDLSVKVTVNGCESNVVTKTIQVSDDPQGYSIVPPNVDICENGIYQFSVSPNNTGSSTYNWQVLKQSDGLPGGGIVADGQTTGVVQIQFLSEDVFVKVSESNASGCTGPPTQIPVAVNKRPTMDNATTAICSGDVTGIILSENATSPVVATTFDVQVPAVLPGIAPVSGPTQGVLAPTGITNDSYKNQTIAPVLSLLYRVKPISAVGCVGEEKSITLDIKAEPVMDITLGKAVCSDNPIEVTLKSAIGFLPADKFVIESIAYDAAVLTPLTPLPATGATLYNPDIIYNHRWENITGSDANVTYNIRPYNSTTGCYGNPAVPVVITIQRKPLVTPVSLPPVCSGDVLNIPLTSVNVNNATFTWTVSQVNGNITGATGSTTNVINDKLVNNSLAVGTVVYEVRATNPSSAPLCSGPAEYITITVRPSPAITTPLNETACSDGYGGNTVVKDLTSYHTQVSTEPGVTYTWFTNENDFAGSQIPPAQITAYTLTDALPVYVRVLNPAATSGCYKDATVTFDVRPTPQLTVDPIETTDPRFNITCNGLANGQIAVSAQYGTNHTFSKDGTTFVPAVLFSNLGAGNYIIYTKNAEGCQDSAPVSIIQPDPIVAGTPSVVDVSCFNDPTPDGEIHIAATGGTAAGGGDALIFSLLQDSNVPYDAVNERFIGLRATTYTVRIEDKNGCTLYVPNIVVKQPGDIAFTIDITSDYNGYDVSCAGQSDGEISVDIANITGGNPGYTYVLDQDPLNLSGTTDGSFQGLSANILYTVTVTDTKGCQKTSLPELLIDPIPLFAGVVGFDKDICEGADPTAFQELSQPFGGIGNYVYRWEESADNIAYAPAAGINNNPTYDPPPLTDLMYYRRVVASGTCAEDITDVVKVVVHTLPQATLTAPSEICENGFFTLDFKFTNGQAPYFFDYSDGTTTYSLVGGEDRPVPILNYTATKTFTLTHLKDFYGCEPVFYPQPVTVKMINMNTSFTVAPVTPQCSGGEYTFTWTVNPDVEYVWNWNDGSPEEVIPAIPGPASPVVMQVKHIFTSANVGGNTVIPVTLTARSTTVAACIKQSVAQNITIYPNIFINVAPDRTQICSGEKVKFVNSTVGGSVHRWFYRTQGGDPSEVREERTFATAATQEYTLTNTTNQTVVYEIVYQVTNGSCSDEIVMPVTVYRSMIADFNATSITAYTGGEAFADFLDTSLPVNDPDFRYEWDFGTASTPTTFDGYTPPQIRYTAIGEKYIRLVVTNKLAEAAGLSCFKDKSLRIEVLLPPLGASFKYTPQATCFPAAITITENNATGDLYEWTLKDKAGNTLVITNETLPVFKVAAPGEYTIFLKTTNSITGQTAESDNRNTPVQIMDNPYAAFEVVPDSVVFVPDETGIQMRNNTLRANNYYWDFNDGGTSAEFQPEHHYQLAGNYLIVLSASHNYGPKDFDGDGIIDGDLICYDTATQVIIAKKGGRIRIPNAFTPNITGPNGGYSDGLFNDVFRPIMDGVEEFQMQIFDRWGNLIFESNDKNQGWDGYDKNGRLLPAGVYVYKIVMRLSDDQRTTQLGDVTLIR
jgi:gliding motility-associated-like protein